MVVGPVMAMNRVRAQGHWRWHSDGSGNGDDNSTVAVVRVIAQW